LNLGLFGVGTGAAAALVAATARPRDVAAVVSQSGRLDLAEAALTSVTASTLLIVGDRDTEALKTHRDAMISMRGRAALEVVSGATWLLEQPGTLARVSELAMDWFARYLPPADIPADDDVRIQLSA
jgi:dienelactone hydrolase